MTKMKHDPGGKAKPPWPDDGMIISAKFSENEVYRYYLSETWNPLKKACMFVMMNPSVASIEHADPTLIRTGKFARSWGFGSQIITNMFAYRATDNKRLLTVDDPVGPDNDQWIKLMVMQSDLIVLAYGQLPKPLRYRADNVIRMLCDMKRDLTYLRLSKDGTPQHPLYLPSDLTPQAFSYKP